MSPELLATLFGGPSQAELMKEAMAVLHSDEVDVDNKHIAFDNLEQLIETIDNANNLEPLGLWPPLLQLLDHEDAGMRRMAATCVGTAVQNNVRAQQHLVSLQTALPALVARALSDPDAAVRRKAVYALSSAVRNSQPALDQMLAHLPEQYRAAQMHAADMDAINAMMDRLRAHHPGEPFAGV